MSEFRPWFTYLLPSNFLQHQNFRPPAPLKYSDIFYRWPLITLKCKHWVMENRTKKFDNNYCKKESKSWDFSNKLFWCPFLLLLSFHILYIIWSGLILSKCYYNQTCIIPHPNKQSSWLLFLKNHRSALLKKSYRINPVLLSNYNY